jgi:hypothetical protein
VLSCSDGAGSRTGPEPPAPPAPVLFIGADNFVITAPADQPPLLYRIDVNADDTTRVRGLAAMTGGFDAGDPGTWLSAQLDRTMAPATLFMRLDARATPLGRHPATITISAAGADPRILHLVLTVVEAHP